MGTGRARIAAGASIAVDDDFVPKEAEISADYAGQDDVQAERRIRPRRRQKARGLDASGLLH